MKEVLGKLPSLPQGRNFYIVNSSAHVLASKYMSLSVIVTPFRFTEPMETLAIIGMKKALQVVKTLTEDGCKGRETFIPQSVIVT